MGIDRTILCGKRAREEEQGHEAVPMPLDSNVGSAIPYLPNPPPAAPQPEGSVVDEIMQDPQPQRPFQASEICVGGPWSTPAKPAQWLVAQRDTPPRSRLASRRRVKSELSKLFLPALPAQSATLVRPPSCTGVSRSRDALRWDQISGADRSKWTKRSCRIGNLLCRKARNPKPGIRRGSPCPARRGTEQPVPQG